MRRLSLAFAATLLAVGGFLSVGSLFFGQSALAQGPTVGVSDDTAEAGGGGSVEIFSRDFEAPGLGAWTIDVGYDPSIIAASACVALVQTSVCNEHYGSGTVRSAGATATGFVGDSSLARIDFTCLREGTTTLRMMPRDVSDATIGGPRLLDVATVDGRVTCAAGGVLGTPGAPPTPVISVPDAGSGGGAGDGGWRIGTTLALLLSAAVVYGAGVRVFARRED